MGRFTAAGLDVLRLRFFVRLENIWHKAGTMTILLVALALLLVHYYLYVFECYNTL